jgi:VWFA-related protein
LALVGRLSVILLSVFLLPGSGFLASGFACQTQKKADEKDQPVRLKTDLFELRAVVTDARGKLVDDLRKEDFELLENNRPQSVSFFSIKHVLDQRTSPPPSTKDAGANSRGRTIVLFVDTLHLTASDALQTRQALRYFVDHQMSDQDMVALVSSAGSLGLLGQFTRDRQLLRFAIDRLPPGISGRGTFFTPYLCSQIVLEVEEALTVGAQIVKAEEGVTASPPGMEPDFLAKRIARQRAVEILIETENKRRLTLLTLREVAERMAGMPGQRLIAYYTGGFTMRGPKGEIDTGDIQSVTSRAVRSGVVIHSIDVRGLYVNPIFDVAAGDIIANGNNLSLLTSYLSHSSREAEDGMNALAKDTGGEAFFNTNDLKGALQKALDEDKTYYALAYYPSDTADKSFRRITLRVKNHPEYRIRTQRGYSPVEATKAELPRTPQERLIQAIMSPLPVTEIGISASADFFASGADKAQVSYEAHIEGQNLSFSEQSGRFQFELELVTTIYDLSGKRVDSFAETVKANLLPQRLELLRRNGLNYSKRLALKPGLYQFRVGVREISIDRIGATSAWVEVPDLNKGKLNLSNIFLRKDLNEEGQAVDVKNGELPGTRTAQGIRSYQQGEFLIYQLMIYNHPSPTQSESELVMQLSLTRGDQAIYQSQWQQLAPLIVKRDKIGIDIGGQFKLSLQPGLYELAIAIEDSKSKRPVQRTVAFNVEP